jgi:single-strand DNA-binding protein
MNHATLIGRLGRDPVLRRTESGNEVTEFSIAVDNHRSRQDDGVDPDWFTIQAWGPLGRTVAANKRKGDRLAVHGRLTPVSWRDTDGARRHTVKITAVEVEFLDGATTTAARRRRTSTSTRPDLPPGS